MSYIKDIYASNENLYHYDASMSYILNNKETVIDPLYIKSVVIDYNYKELNMPMIFVTITITQDLLDTMIENQDIGIVIFNMNRAVANSNSSEIFTKYISDEFLYFITEGDDPSLDENSNMYVSVTVGLLSKSCIDNNKKEFSGVVKSNQASILYYILSHMPVVIEQPKSKEDMNIVIPPINSISKMLQYINSINTIYTTPYRFFIDFDCAYLLSSSGKPVLRKTDNINTILFSLKNEYDEDGKTLGMKVDTSKSIYEIYIDEGDYEISDEHIYKKSFSKVIGTDASGKVLKKDIFDTSNSNNVAKHKSIRLANNNSALLDNYISSIRSSSLQFMIERYYIDSSIITPNKEYIIHGDEVYNFADYNGNYILTHKRDVFLKEEEKFISSTMMMFEKATK